MVSSERPSSLTELIHVVSGNDSRCSNKAVALHTTAYELIGVFLLRRRLTPDDIGAQIGDFRWRIRVLGTIHHFTGQ